MTLSIEGGDPIVFVCEWGGGGWSPTYCLTLKWESRLNFYNTFIALIPKKYATKELKNLITISLMGSVTAKVLTFRLKPVMVVIISPSQGTFMAKRQILDGVLIANECVDASLRDNKEGVMYKIDLEKGL